MASNTETIIFGGGCFWCTEAVFQMLRGVKSTMPGYAGGSTANPKYWDVAGGDTGHAEVLKVEYDKSVIPFGTLLEVFFEMHDPTSLNRQGADTGTEYRSLILYTTDEQKKEIAGFIKKIAGNYNSKIVTEVKRLDKFYPAEKEHKDFYLKNQGQMYCSIVISPKVDKIRKEFSTIVK